MEITEAPKQNPGTERGEPWLAKPEPNFIRVSYNAFKREIKAKANGKAY